MRGVLVLLLVMACGKSKPTPSQGSGLTAPQQKLMDAVADGVFEPPHDAAPPPADAAAPAPDAAVATGPTISNKDGLSKLMWNKQDENATAAIIQKKIGLPDVTVSFDVMDVPGEVETEEGYWSVKRGDKEIVQVLRASIGPDEGPAAVIVWTPEVPTVDGIKVGDTVATLQAKHADLACHGTTIASTVSADTACRSASEKHIAYFLDAETAKGQTKTAKLANVKIVAIAHEF
jgi:hypothetical protein